ncbi:MAG: hypothetical protein U5R49_07845 [Deltaproteobacteria bacterium]|nr:hypothetical protein [Deltaproteobacteria bacterium]
MGAEVYDHIGGTEPCAWAAMCQERSGLHLMEPFFLVEILDLSDSQREVEPGELGRAVVTPLGRRSFPLIRFDTNDVVRKGSGGCPCGRTSAMISEVMGRADHLRKIRGVLFTPVSVEEVLRKDFPEINEYEITVNKKGLMDDIRLKLEPHEPLGQDMLADIRPDPLVEIHPETAEKEGIETDRCPRRSFGPKGLTLESPPLNICFTYLTTGYSYDAKH